MARLGNSEFFLEERDPAPGILAVQALMSGGFAGT